MRSFLIIAVVAGVALAAGYQKFPTVRETIRGWLVPDEDQERLDAYRQGKTLFALKWDGDSVPHFEAWGDDTSEGAQDVAGNLWLAHGHLSFSKGAVKTRESWCILFVMNQGDTLIRVTGPAADETLRLVNAGKYREAAAQFAATGNINVPGAATPKPAPGAWMWDKNAQNSALDQPNLNPPGSGSKRR